jgi:hypothetical protein
MTANACSRAGVGLVVAGAVAMTGIARGQDYAYLFLTYLSLTVNPATSLAHRGVSTLTR